MASILEGMASPAQSVPTEAAAELRSLVGRLSRRLRRTESGVGLSPTQLSVLGALARHGPMASAELSEHEGINPTMLSRIVARLAAMGLIARDQDPLDGRAAVLSATAQGRHRQLRIQAERDRVLERSLATLEERQRGLLLEALPILDLLAEQLRDDSG